MILGNLVISGVLTLFGNLVADVGYVLADPRISFTKQG
jgi:peptide/nickel transport system permease protein